jgi:hypothetical protein
MRKFLLAPQLLQLLEEGKLFRVIFAWILRIQAALAILVGVLLSIELWRFASGLNTGGILGLLLLQCCLVVAFTFIMHLSWLRASGLLSMNDVHTEGGRDAIPVTQLLLRLGGEIFASLMAACGVGGAFLVWLSAGDGIRALSLLPIPSNYAGDVFQAGLTVLGTGLLLAACALLGAYFLVGMIDVLVSIEKNTRKN